jgi:hypothetical protein
LRASRPDTQHFPRLLRTRRKGEAAAPPISVMNSRRLISITSARCNIALDRPSPNSILGNRIKLAR